MSWLNDAVVTTREEKEADAKSSLLAQLESARKAAEADGVVIDGVPFRGDPDNRAALLESVQFAREAGIEKFAKWKDSSGDFHPDYPLSCVEEGLNAIAARRGLLIEREAGYTEQVASGQLTDVSNLDWNTEN